MTKTKDEISAWLVQYLARILETDAILIDATVPLGEYGMDSAGAAGLSADLAEWLGVPLKESIAFDYPTVAALSEHVSALGDEQACHG